jgi:thiamine-monophosphate kinase
MTVGELTESDLIATISDRLPAKPDWMVIGVGDDAAVVEPMRNRLEVLSVDALVEGVHFDRSFTPPDAIGHRALAVNLSDLAAMGASARMALLSFALPPDLPLADFQAIVGGLLKAAAAHRVAIAGGNLTRTSGPLVLDVTVAGAVKRRRALTRAGARPGDDLFVTGSIGAAAAGLQMLKARAAGSCVDRYLYPEPRLKFGSLLSTNRAATACMDLSDGLAEAIRQLAEASGIGVTVDVDSLPIDADARRWFEEHGLDAVTEAMTGGDDYELLVACNPRTRGRLAAARRHGGAPLTRIGACTADRALVLRQQQTTERDRPFPRGYTHFR